MAKHQTPLLPLLVVVLSVTIAGSTIVPMGATPVLHGGTTIDRDVAEREALIDRASFDTIPPGVNFTPVPRRDDYCQWVDTEELVVCDGVPQTSPMPANQEESIYFLGYSGPSQECEVYQLQVYACETIEDPDEIDYWGGGGSSNQGNGYLTCEWGIVDSTHWRKTTQPQANWHTYCQLFGAKKEQCGRTRDHQGVDWSASDGDIVRAMGNGKVTEVDSGHQYNGTFVRIKHPDGNESTYIHLQEYSVAVGDEVTAGQQIGKADTTGNTTASHLHAQLKNSSGQVIDPLSVMTKGC